VITLRAVLYKIDGKPKSAATLPKTLVSSSGRRKMLAWATTQRHERAQLFNVNALQFLDSCLRVVAQIRRHPVLVD
jgi:hypothetical protein